MKDFESQGFAAEKRINHQTLALFNTLEILNGIRCVEITLYPSKYNEILVRDFYVNLFEGVDISTNPAFGAIYVRGTPIAFTPSNIASFLNCPHYEDLEGTGLERDANWNTVAHALIGDKKAAWLANNRFVASQLQPV